MAFKLRPKLSAGFALGTDAYFRPDNRDGSIFGTKFNTLPITANIQNYLLSPDKGVFTDLYAGYAAKIFNNFDNGLTFGLGVGYEFTLTKKLGLRVKTGYNLQRIQNGLYSVNEDLYRTLQINSIRVEVGLKFNKLD